MILNKSCEPYYVLGKKFSNSTLKSMTKDKLIECLDIAQHNYEWVNERLFNATQYAEKLDEALDKACELISELGGCYPIYERNKRITISCQESCTNNPKKCWREYLLKGDKE